MAVGGSILAPAMHGRLWADARYLLVAMPYLWAPFLATALWRRFVIRELPPAGDALILGPTVLLALAGPIALAWVAALFAHAFGWGTIDLGGAGIVAIKAQQEGTEVAATLEQALAAAPLPYPVVASIEALFFGALLAPIRYGEESAWRGALHRELSALGFWNAALLGGFLWGLWRVPLVALGGFFPDHPIAGPIVTIAASIPTGALLAWIRVRSNSLWAGAAFQGVLAALGPFHELILVGGDPLIVSPIGAAGGLAASIGAVVLFLREPRGPVPVLAPA